MIGPIMQADEKAALTTTAVLIKMISMVRSKVLLKTIILFIVSATSGGNEKVGCSCKY